MCVGRKWASKSADPLQHSRCSSIEPWEIYGKCQEIGGKPLEHPAQELTRLTADFPWISHGFTILPQGYLYLKSLTTTSFSEI